MIPSLPASSAFTALATTGRTLVLFERSGLVTLLTCQKASNLRISRPSLLKVGFVSLNLHLEPFHCTAVQLAYRPCVSGPHEIDYINVACGAPWPDSLDNRKQCNVETTWNSATISTLPADDWTPLGCFVDDGDLSCYKQLPCGLEASLADGSQSVTFAAANSPGSASPRSRAS